MKFDNKGKFILTPLRIMIFLHCFVFIFSYGKEQELENKIHYPSSQEEKTTPSIKITGDASENNILRIQKTDTINEPFEQKILPQAKRMEQEIIYHMDKKEERGSSLDKMVDSSIFFATLVVVILAFMLQGIRIWLSELKQDYFNTMAFLSEPCNKNKYAGIKAKLKQWSKQIDGRKCRIDYLFGALYFLLLTCLVSLILMCFSRNFHAVLAWFLYFVTTISGIVLFLGVVNLMWRIKIDCSNYGGVERSLRRLQEEIFNQTQGGGKNG